jgi:SH3-like domain-containing protein
MKRVMAAVLAAALIAGMATARTDPNRKPPYWASISAGQARMRTGPGRNYPASWFYQRQGLPVQVIEVFPGWRKIRDQDGTAGWMISQLISDRRTAMIRGSGTVDLHASPSASARVLFHAEVGVIGVLGACAEGWCRLDVQGKAGFVEEERLWGVDPGETIG